MIKKYLELTDCTPLMNVIIYTFNDIIVFFSQNMNGVMDLQITFFMQLYDIIIKQFYGSIWAIKLHWLDQGFI